MSFGLFNDQRGVGLAEFLVAMGVLSVIAMGLTTYNETLRRQQVNLTPTAGLAALSVSIPYLITDDASWKASVVASNLRCLQNGAGPCGGPMSLSILQDANGVIATSWSGSNGLEVTGKPCSTYPSAGCPLRYQIVITPLTGGAYPLVEVSVVLVSQAAPVAGRSWNMARYSYSNSATSLTTSPNRPIRRTAIP